MADRYARNKNSIDSADQAKLGACCVAVVGLGGLGGYIAEQLARIGIGKLILIDGDVFEPSNLNRQLLATESNLGRSKAEVAQERVALVNASVQVTSHATRLDADNAPRLLFDACLVMDAVDSVSTRRLLQDVCEKLDLPMVHGAISGWCGQVSFIAPKDRLIDLLYPPTLLRDSDTQWGNPPFTPGLVASIQVAEAVKWILNKGELLQNRVLRIDLSTHEYEVIKIK
jgi:molybdopterin/thiamine biosynthesis adenylyltransferase